MPRHPHVADAVEAIRASVFRSNSFDLARRAPEFFPFHVGDTWMEPPEGCRMEDLREADHPGMHRYAPPRGTPALIDAVVDRCRARMGLDIERESVLVSSGATGGLAAILGAILSPGDRVLVLAPYWPLIEGIVRTFRGYPVAVPFIGEADSADSAVAVLEDSLSDEVVALYLSTPNNPTGRVIPGPWIEALVEWAARRGLWVISDEVYEDYVYEGSHTYSLALAPDRTFSVHSFSKAYGMAGNRCGYVLGPPGVMDAVEKISTHLCYNATTAAQIAAGRAIDGAGDAWLARARDLYRDAGTEAAAILGVAPPQGSTFLFLDVREQAEALGIDRVTEACARHGVTVAPGTSFGPYPHHLRVCFTAAPPDTVRRGMTLLAQALDAG
jgi:N-succinyldiaminopimelate aminotransferase